MAMLNNQIVNLALNWLDAGIKIYQNWWIFGWKLHPSPCDIMCSLIEKNHTCPLFSCFSPCLITTVHALTPHRSNLQWSCAESEEIGRRLGHGQLATVLATCTSPHGPTLHLPDTKNPIDGEAKRPVLTKHDCPGAVSGSSNSWRIST